ncbi:hypothetical protein AAG906_017664 [Vitis piasezkii]
MCLSILSSAYQELKNASQVLTMNNLAGTIISQVLQLDPTNEAAKENIQVCSILPQLMLLFALLTKTMPSQSGSSNTKKSPMPEISESRDLENIDDALALLSLSSSPLLENTSSVNSPLSKRLRAS